MSACDVFCESGYHFPAVTPITFWPIKTSVVRGIKDFHKNHVSSFFIMAMDLFLATELLKRKAKVLLLTVTVSFSIPSLWNPSSLIRGGVLPVSSHHGKTVKN